MCNLCIVNMTIIVNKLEQNKLVYFNNLNPSVFIITYLSII